MTPDERDYMLRSLHAIAKATATTAEATQELAAQFKILNKELVEYRQSMDSANKELANIDVETPTESKNNDT